MRQRRSASNIHGERKIKADNERKGRNVIGEVCNRKGGRMRGKDLER